MKKIKLSSLEKYILAHETATNSFASNLILETKKPLDVAKMKLALGRIFNEIPYLRSCIEVIEGEPVRCIADSCWFDPADRFKILESLEIEDIPRVIDQKFDLSKEPALKISYGPSKSGNYILVMTVHHVSIDGYGQAYLLNEFFQAYYNYPLSPWVGESESFHFRTEIFSRIGFFKGTSLLFFSLLNLLFSKKKPAATLIDQHDVLDRRTTFLSIPIDGKDQELRKKASQLGFNGIFEFLIFCITRALDECLVSRGELEKPIVVIIPLNLRHRLKIKGMFQNIDGLCKIVIPRGKITEVSFPTFLGKKLRSGLGSAKALSVILLMATVDLFFSFRKMKKAVQRSERQQGNIYSSIFVSAGKLPNLAILSSDLEIERIYGYGSLTKSPGLGVIFTGEANKQTLVVEYIEGLISKETALKFRDELVKRFVGGSANLRIQIKEVQSGTENG